MGGTTAIQDFILEEHANLACTIGTWLDDARRRGATPLLNSLSSWANQTDVESDIRAHLTCDFNICAETALAGMTWDFL